MVRQWTVERNGYQYKGIELPSGSIDIIDLEPCPESGYVGGAFFGPVEEALRAGFQLVGVSHPAPVGDLVHTK